MHINYHIRTYHHLLRRLRAHMGNQHMNGLPISFGCERMSHYYQPLLLLEISDFCPFTVGI